MIIQKRILKTGETMQPRRRKTRGPNGTAKDERTNAATLREQPDKVKGVRPMRNYTASGAQRQLLDRGVCYRAMPITIVLPTSGKTVDYRAVASTDKHGRAVW